MLNTFTTSAVSALLAVSALSSSQVSAAPVDASFSPINAVGRFGKRDTDMMSGESCSTWYGPNGTLLWQGGCGILQSNRYPGYALQPIAIPSAIWSAHLPTGADANSNPLCGRIVTITAQNYKTTTAVVADCQLRRSTCRTDILISFFSERAHYRSNTPELWLIRPGLL